MRVISSNITRMYCARSGGVMPEQPLDREHVAVLVAHHRHVVEPVHVADRLVERLALGELLGRAVQQADVRIGLLDDLAVDLEHEPQHAVRRRMLRPEVQREVLDLRHCRGSFEVGLVAVVVADDFRHERARLDAHGLVDDAALHRVVAHLDVADQRKILAERMADEAVVRQQAAQIRVAAEQDAVEIERLALEPIGRVPDVDRRNRRSAARRSAQNVFRRSR